MRNENICMEKMSGQQIASEIALEIEYMIRAMDGY